VLVLWRRSQLETEHEIESFLSKESMFLFTVVILACICFATLWGTVFPLISEIFKGVQITVGQTFFNQVTIPQFLILLALMGICPLIAWRKASMHNLQKNFLIPGIILIATLIMLIVFKINLVSPLISFSLCAFVMSIIIIEFYRGTKAYHNSTGKNYLTSFFSVIGKNKRRYGGYIVHIGIVLTFFGVTGSSAFVKETEVHLKRGESVNLGQYNLQYVDIAYKDTPHKEIVTAQVAVFKNGKYMATMLPEKNFFRTREQPATEVAIISNLEHDLYAILGGYEMNGNATFKFLINPLVLWMWIGCLVIALGTIVAIYPDKQIVQKSTGEK
ncbi:heme lyase CcmF/NrfE family subunit, partial [Candidatus Poribacteria bacterium]|nr:heme lyase CcmF/NrfE family subunit [Candidatus Poribacteria bacterium]